MIRSGTKPAKHIYRERKFHQLFGSTDPALIPDFNLDVGLTMPDQEADHAFTECVGYTVSDILTDITRVVQSPDFSFSAARCLANQSPGSDGTDFHAGIQGGVVFGGVTKSFAKFSAAQQGEQYVSDWNNWMAVRVLQSIQGAQNGVLNVLGNGDAFDSILNAVYTGKIGISIGSPWFNEWETNIQNGVVQVPTLNGDYSSWHNYAIKGKKTINGIPYLIVKSWQGTRVGDNGWLYFSREVINAALSVQGSGALTFNPNASRLISIMGILAQRPPAFSAVIPQLLKASL